MSSATDAQQVLVVDDSPSIRSMVAFVLREEGYAVEEAPDGEAALDWARSGNRADLVITDVNMPGMSGIDLIEALRGLDAYEFTPILTLTTESSRERKLEGKRAGATGWIVKPFEPDLLLDTIRRVF